mgnify:CR=1 FL=1
MVDEHPQNPFVFKNFPVSDGREDVIGAVFISKRKVDREVDIDILPRDFAIVYRIVAALEAEAKDCAEDAAQNRGLSLIGELWELIGPRKLLACFLQTHSHKITYFLKIL